MTTFAGLDLSQAKTAVCLVDDRGLVTWRGSCATAPEAIAHTLARRASSLERVGLASGPLAPWLVHELRALAPAGGVLGCATRPGGLVATLQLWPLTDRYTRG